MATNDFSDLWTCQVRLRKYDPNGAAHEEAFGPVILVPAEVEDMLRRAQLAVLNPSMPLDDFIAYDLIAHDKKKGDQAGLVSETQLSFTRNTVCIEIKGPHVFNLTFTDLPGKSMFLEL